MRITGEFLVSIEVETSDLDVYDRTTQKIQCAANYNQNELIEGLQSGRLLVCDFEVAFRLARDTNVLLNKADIVKDEE